MNGHRRLAALFVTLELGGCGGVTRQGQAPYAPYRRRPRGICTTVATAVCSGQSPASSAPANVTRYLGS